MYRKKLFCFLCLLGSFVFCAIAYWQNTGTMLIWHIPAAVLAYVGFVSCVIINLCIALGAKLNEGLSVASCDVGLVFSGITMLSGMLWGKTAWGVYWVWEPRLTGMLLMTLIFVSWRIAENFISARLVGSKLTTSILCVFGLPSMAFTHLAGKLFGGIHPTHFPASGSDASWSVWAIIAVILAYAFFASFVFTISYFIKNKIIIKK